MNNALRLAVITLLLAASSLSAATHYVSLESTNPTPPYYSWATAATNIQIAVDTANAGDAIVVAEGVYKAPWWVPDSLVVIPQGISLLSLNGPDSTAIEGSQYAPRCRCVSLADGASVSGFTLTNGAPSAGGGVWCMFPNAFLTNCTVTGNTTTPVPWGNLGPTGPGGGVYGGTLYNCALTYNSAGSNGGGFCVKNTFTHKAPFMEPLKSWSWSGRIQSFTPPAVPVCRAAAPLIAGGTRILRGSSREACEVTSAVSNTLSIRCPYDD